MSFSLRAFLSFAIAFFSIPFAQSAVLNPICKKIDTSAAILVILSSQWSEAALEFCSTFIHIPAVTKTVVTSYSVTTVSTTTPIVVISTTTLPTTISTVVVSVAGSTETDFTTISTSTFSAIASTETDFTTPFSTTLSTTIGTEIDTTTVTTSTIPTTDSTETDTITVASVTLPVTVSTETDATTIGTQTVQSIVSTETDITDVATRTIKTTYSTQVPYTTTIVTVTATSTLPAMRKRDAEIQGRTPPTPSIPAFLKIWASSVISDACSCVATFISQATVPVTVNVASSVLATSPTSIVSTVYSSVTSTTYSSTTQTDILSVAASETTSLTTTEVFSVTASETTSITLTEISSVVALETTSVTATETSSVTDTEYSSAIATVYSSVSATAYSSITRTVLSSDTLTAISSIVYTSPTKITRITQTSSTTVTCPSPTVSNGDFESGQLSPFTLQWLSLLGGSAPGTCAVVPNTLGTAANGNYYLQIITPQNNATQAALLNIWDPPPCLNGQNYTLTADYYFNSTGIYLIIDLLLSNHFTEVTASAVATAMPTNEWLTISTAPFTFNTSSDAPIVNLDYRVIVTHPEGQSAMVLADNFRLVRV